MCLLKCRQTPACTKRRCARFCAGVFALPLTAGWFGGLQSVTTTNNKMEIYHVRKFLFLCFTLLLCAAFVMPQTPRAFKVQ